MMEIAIYVEGGGDTAQQKSELRQGFDELLSPLKAKAREKRLRWKLIPCGGRQQTYEAFLNSLKANPTAVNILLVDSESELPAFHDNPAEDARLRIEHLAKRDKWVLSGINPHRIHLMVQCMETWISADPEILEGFYKKNFKRNILPTRNNLEEEPKSDIYEKLRKATQDTQNGEYGKICHASKLLKLIRPAEIEQRCPRFKEFIRSLEEIINAS
jgi:hypothetical protein